MSIELDPNVMNIPAIVEAVQQTKKGRETLYYKAKAQAEKLKKTKKKKPLTMGGKVVEEQTLPFETT